MTRAATKPENEFIALPDTAAALGVSAPPDGAVRRRWFTASLDGHVSGVFWGDGLPSAVLVPDDGSDARSLDELALLLNQPIVILDRPGTGRSSGPAVTAQRSGRVLAEAVWSFAPRTATLIGLGPGGAAAALATAARAATVERVLVTTPEPVEADSLPASPGRSEFSVVYLATDHDDVAATAAAVREVLTQSVGS